VTPLQRNPEIRRLAVPAGSIVPTGAIRAEVLNLYPNAKFNDAPGILGEDALIEFLSDCDATIVGMEPITDKVLKALPDLKIIGKFGAGYDTVDFAAVQRAGVRLGYLPGINALSVAEVALSFMINALRLITPQNQAMREGLRPRFAMGRMLSGRTVGIHGMGHVGREIVRLLHPFRCEILACDIRDRSAFYADNNIQSVSFEELVERSEVLSLHLPKSSATVGLYSRKVLARMRPDAVLINTCRGGIVDEDALLERLKSGALSAACFDVFAIEPAINDELLRHPRMLATPHLCAAVEEVRLAMIRAAIQALVTCKPVELAEWDR
jgi:D-3-phosphoglycerate dehydrogenase